MGLLKISGSWLLTNPSFPLLVKDCWWPSSMPAVQRPKPPYDKQSTQRSDFREPSCRLSRPIKYSSKLQPSRGIVPLASPQPSTSLPRIFQERLSFKHHYDARATPCVPYQGKKHGTFVWTEIKPTKGATDPEGTGPLPCAGGSGSLEQPRAEKGKSEEGCVTSACLRLPDSQETPPDSDTQLSKTDIRTGAKADPRAPEKGQEIRICHFTRASPSGPSLFHCL
uniref:Ciliary microtubule inner protein 6 n=1 Tax=Salvator merianae TaxID=96440 RepID=A0A8D0CFA9_SALMN